MKLLNGEPSSNPSCADDVSEWLMRQINRPGKIQITVVYLRCAVVSSKPRGDVRQAAEKVAIDWPFLDRGYRSINPFWKAVG